MQRIHWWYVRTMLASIFLREHNVSVMIRFKNVFEKLESLGHPDAHENTDLWALHYIHVPFIKKRIDELKNNYDHRPLSEVNHESTHIMYLTSSLNNQVININIDP